MTYPARTPAFALSALLCGTGLAFAQADAPADATTVQTPQANAESSQCVAAMRDLNSQMQNDGFWLSGWSNRGGGAVPTGGMAPTVGEPAPVDPNVAAPGRDPSGQPTGMGQPMGPWGDVGWTQHPRYEIRSLHNAAMVLAQRGNEQACMQVVDAASEVYGQYSEQLREAGLSPDEVTGWRQEQLIAAQPVSEIQGAISSDNVVGSDVRNPEDENLGEIDTIMVSPQTGAIQYVVVSRGGFLGLGEDRVVVPWNQLRVTPGMNTFVLAVSEEAMENAPSLDDVEETGSVSSADDYWSRALGENAAPAPAQ